MRRGEVWWAHLPEPHGRRPVLLLSRDEAYVVRELVIVAAVTTRIRDIPAEVALDVDDGMAQRCVVNCDVIETIDKATLERRQATLSEAKLDQVDMAVRFALGIA